MTITRSNTTSGSVTRFDALGNGEWFDNATRGGCIKLDADLLKRLSDGGVESGISSAEEVTLVPNDNVNVTAAAGDTFGSLGNGQWFVDFTRGLCIKLNSNQLKRKSDGAVESDVGPNTEVVAKSDSDISGTFDP